MESFEESSYANGNTDLAISRTTQTDTTQLYGKIGSIVLPVPAGINTVQSLSLFPSAVRGITYSESEVVFNTTGDSVIVDPAFTGTFPDVTNITFNLYPNPTSDDVQIIFGYPAKRTVSLMDVTGRILLVKSVSAKQTEFNMQDLASGIYVMNVRDESGKLCGSDLIIRK
jgi:hypothetical protein